MVLQSFGDRHSWELPAPAASKRRPLDAPRPRAHTPRIADGPPASESLAPSERLARRWFAAVEDRAFTRLPELIHEDITLVSRVQAGKVVHGRAAVTRFIEETVARQLYEAHAEVYAPLDDTRVAVQGRMRWIDDKRVIRDDPVVWALEFEDDLLIRFVPARTFVEAETLLSA